MMTMKIPLKNLVTLFCISLIGLSVTAHAKWSMTKKVGLSKPSTLINTGETQTHFVQIFSSINATKAEGMKNTLEMRGYPAFINVKDQQRQPRYRVQIGPFQSRKLADKAKYSIIQSYPQFPFLNDAILKTSFHQY